MVAFKHKLTDQTKKHVEAGKKQCTQCKQVLPLESFHVVNLNTKNGRRSRLQSYCKQCAKKYAHKRRHEQKREAMFQNILVQDECDACGESGAEWFYCRTTGREYTNFCVIHEECKGDAVQEGLIPSMSTILRHKDTIFQGHQQAKDLNRKYPKVGWSKVDREALRTNEDRQCSKCGLVLPLEMFPVYLDITKKQKTYKRIRKYCRDCRNQSQRLWRKRKESK